jgi:hypothetical protein
LVPRPQRKARLGDQVRPFNFLSAFQASRFSSNSDDADSLGAEIQTKGRRKRHCVLKPIAPYNAGAARAPEKYFDRETGKPISDSMLKPYRQSRIAARRNAGSRRLRHYLYR